MPYEASGAAYSRSRLRIYRYELPWDVAFPMEVRDAWGTYDGTYGAFEHFYNAFSPDWEVSKLSTRHTLRCSD